MPTDIYQGENVKKHAPPGGLSCVSRSAVYAACALPMFVLSGCVSVMQFPGDSHIRGLLAEQTFENLRVYEKNHNDCALVRIVSTKHVKESGPVRLNEDGLLLEGVIVEQWVVDACGHSRNYKVVLGGQPQSGSYYTAFQELQAQETDSSKP